MPELNPRQFSAPKKSGGEPLNFGYGNYSAENGGATKSDGTASPQRQADRLRDAREWERKNQRN